MKSPLTKRPAYIAEDESVKDNSNIEVDLDAYPPKAQREKEFKDLIMNEIKSKDKDFYDKWCNNEN